MALDSEYSLLPRVILADARIQGRWQLESLAHLDSGMRRNDVLKISTH